MLGEGWHNNHHHSMALARQGFCWWETDFTYYTFLRRSRRGLLLQFNGANLQIGCSSKGFGGVRPHGFGLRFVRRNPAMGGFDHYGQTRGVRRRSQRPQLVRHVVAECSLRRSGLAMMMESAEPRNRASELAYRRVA